MRIISELGSKGWVRAGKGHELDPVGLTYKAGDEYKAHALGKSNEQVVFIDSNGRSYSLLSSTLPSVRGYGEPLTSKLEPESGSTFEAVLMGYPEQQFIIISDVGYGFRVTFDDLLSKNRKGKALIDLPAGSKILAVLAITTDLEQILDPKQASADVNKTLAGIKLALADSNGRMLIAAIDTVPQMAKGKGKRLLSLTAQEIAKGDRLVAAAVIQAGKKLLVTAGRTKAELTSKELKAYSGELGDRGNKLPAGMQKVKALAGV